MSEPSGHHVDGDQPSAALLREMNSVGGMLFAAGGALVLFVLLVGAWSGVDRRMLTVTATVALGAGCVLLVLANRHPLQVGTLNLLAVLGTANITATILGAGPQGSAAFGVLYVFVTVFSFYYFTFREAVGQVVLTAVAYAGALHVVTVSDPASQWLVVTGSNVIIGFLIGRGGNRIRDLLIIERDAVARLRELDELRTAFLRAVSHELRTPLTTVIGNAETLQQRRHLLDEMQVDLLIDRISSNGKRLESMLTNLLDIDRISRGIVQPRRSKTDVGMLARRIVSEMHTKSHPVEVLVVGDPTIDVETSKIERIVENLVGNAVRHTPVGTPIRVSVSDGPRGVTLSVEDDGPGVPDVMALRIFEPFEQGPSASSSPNPGTGIGLALVAKFAELHGGRAWVARSASGGASFHVHLPRPASTPADEDQLEVNAAEQVTTA